MKRTRRWSIVLVLVGSASLLGLSIYVGSPDPEPPTSGTEVHYQPLVDAQTTTRVDARTEARINAGTETRIDGQIESRFEVIFDQSNEQVYSPYDTSYTGFSELAAAIMQIGGGIALNNRPLTELLANGDHRRTVLVLGVAMFRRYAENDLEAIDRFMQSGGGVLLMVEHDDFMENATMQNQLLRQYGIVAEASGVSSTDPGTGRLWVECESTLYQMDRIRFFLAAPLITEHDDIETLARVKRPAEVRHRHVALKNFNNARLIVLADAEIAWNGDQHLGIAVADNREFLLHAITELAGVEYGEEPRTQASKIADDGRRRIVFLRDGNAIVPTDVQPLGRVLEGALEEAGYSIDIAFSGEVDLKDYELAVLANPLRPLTRPEDYLQARKLLLVADGSSDIITAEPEFRKLIQDLTGSEIAGAVLPINSLAKLLGLHFAAETLVTDRPKEQNHLFIEALAPASGRTVTVYRSTWVETDPKAAGNAADWIHSLLAEPAAWGSGAITPKQDTARPTKPFLRPVTLANLTRPIISSTEQVMAVADIELLFGEAAPSSGQELLSQALLNWLQE